MQISTVLKSKGSSVATIGRDATVAAAVAELARRNVGALVVSNDGRVVDGIISERDVTRALGFCRRRNSRRADPDDHVEHGANRRS